MLNLNIDPSLIQQQAERRAARLQTLKMVDEKMPARKAKGAPITRTWAVLEEMHELLIEYDILAEPPAIAATYAETFDRVATHLYDELTKNEKPTPSES